MNSAPLRAPRIVLIPVLLALFSTYTACIWSFVSSHEGWSLWTASFVLFAVLATVCAAGLLTFRSWAYALGVMLGLVSLGFGLYAAHFAWTFWLFEEPTFAKRVAALFRPQIFCFYVFPSLWLFWITRPSNRSLFSNNSRV